MKFAVIDGQRREAEPGLSGVCQACGRALVTKCGEIRDWHWAHQKSTACDPWWENETEWHRAWKGQFPSAWQEVVHPASDGTRHIADVATEGGWVIEFQHSPIENEERQSRNAFYRKLVWVVNGTRRKKDAAQFTEAKKHGRWLVAQPPMVRLRSGECVLLREWAGSSVPILLDFGIEQSLWLIAGHPDGPAYARPIPRATFIGMHRGEALGAGDFDSFIAAFYGEIAAHEAETQALELRQSTLQTDLAFRRLTRGPGPRGRF